MQFSITDLSSELLDTICEFIHCDPENSLDALSRSCKLLCDISAPHMFNSMTVSEAKVEERRLGGARLETFEKDMANCERALLTRSLEYIPAGLWSINLVQMLHRKFPKIEQLIMCGTFPRRWIDPRSFHKPRLARFRKMPVERQDFNYAVADVIKEFTELRILGLPHVTKLGTLFNLSQSRRATARMAVDPRHAFYENLAATTFLEECPRLERVFVSRSSSHAPLARMEITREMLGLRHDSTVHMENPPVLVH